MATSSLNGEAATSEKLAVCDKRYTPEHAETETESAEEIKKKEEESESKSKESQGESKA